MNIIVLFFISFFVLLIFGIPVAFSLGISSLVLLIIEGRLPLLLIPQRMFAGLDSWLLMAIPFFMFAGALMEKGGIAEQIIKFANSVLCFLKGSIAYVSIAASMIFSGVNGSSTADTAAVGSICIPAMIKKGYDPRFATVIEAASGSMGPVIPPSILMIVIGFTINTSIAQLFVAGIIPGVLIALFLSITTYIVASRGGEAYSSNEKFNIETIKKNVIPSLPALGLPVIILGGIITGIFTPTEAGVIAAVYGLLISLFVYKNITIREIKGIFLLAIERSSSVLIIIGFANLFAWLVTSQQVPMLLANLMQEYIHTKIGFLILFNLLFLFIGCFMESYSAVITLVPIFFPIAVAYGIDPVHFGIMTTVNLGVGFITPPYGVTLFVACGISGETMRTVTPYILPIFAAMVAVLLLVTYFPAVVLWLPKMFF